MEDPELKIQTFRPTWEEFKDFPKYIKFIESKGAQKAGLAKVIAPPEYIPRKSGYEDLKKLNVKIRKPICQAAAKLQGSLPGAYVQVNIPIQSMTITDFEKIANSPKYATPPHKDNADLDRIYWETMTEHAPIYGADLSGTISDPELEHWNINKLGTILDLIGDELNISIEGVNTAYLYFGMWKTTFCWHDEDMDLYSINYLHFGASKTWYAIPPRYGKKFEKLCTALYPKSAKTCAAFLRHKMTVLAPKWLKDYDIPYDTITQEPGEFMITFPYGYHCGYNHGFNCAESTNFAIERWINYGKYSSKCYCTPDAVKIDMDIFVKTYQPEIYELWKQGKDPTPHPEFNLSPLEKSTPQSTEQMAFKERYPDLNVDEILANPNIDPIVKAQLTGSMYVSVEEETAALNCDYEETEKIVLKSFYDDSSDEEETSKKKRRKKHDSDYDDDWYETKGHKFISEDGKTVRKQREVKPRARRTVSPKLEGEAGATKVIKKRRSAPAATKAKPVTQEVPLSDPQAKLILIETKEKKVTVMSAKPSSLPSYLASLPKPVPPKPLLPQQKTYSDQFAQFLNSTKKTVTTSPPSVSKPPASSVPSNVTAKVIVQPSQPPPLALSITKPQQVVAIVNKTPLIVTPAQRKQEEWTQMVLQQSQQAASTQKVKTERIQPYVPGQSQLYLNQIQANGGSSSLYNIMNSSSGTQPRMTVSNGAQGYQRK